MTTTTRFDSDQQAQHRFPRLHRAFSAVRQHAKDVVITAFGALFGATLMFGVFLAPLPATSEPGNVHASETAALTSTERFGFARPLAPLAETDEPAPDTGAGQPALSTSPPVAAQASATARPFEAVARLDSRITRRSAELIAFPGDVGTEAQPSDESPVESTLEPTVEPVAAAPAKPSPTPEADETANAPATPNAGTTPSEAKPSEWDEPDQQAKVPIKASNVKLHYVRGAAGPRAGQLHMRLLKAGFARVEASYVTFDIASSQIRYFHAEDLERARAVQKMAGSGQRFEIRNFTKFSPRPNPGLVEIWMR